MSTEIDLGIDHLTDVTMIGSGGFSVVYSASHTLFKRRMAVKLLNPLTKESERMRFERECEVMGRLSDHPNVVSVYNAGYTKDGRPYLLMELVEGGSLHDRTERDGPLSWQDAVAHLIPICDALAAAHGESILHRDVKPENILLTEQGEPRLADFGIASLRDATGATSTHITASMLHTPPETFENTRDERSDLYSLASTLFALIAGRAPFWQDTDQSIHPLMNRLLNEPAPGIDPSLAPPALSALVQRALAKNPDDRPQTAAEFAAELRAISGGESSAPAWSAPAEPEPELDPDRTMSSPAPFMPPRPSTSGPVAGRPSASNPIPQPFASGPVDDVRPQPSEPVPQPQQFQPQSFHSGPVDDVRPATGPTPSAPGWYHGPGDPIGTQRYWTGNQWQGAPRSVSGPVGPGGAPPGYGQSGPVGVPPGFHQSGPTPPASGIASAERRLLARTIDICIWLFIWAIFLVIIIPSGDNEDATYLQILLLGLVSTTAIATYEITMVAAAGGTIGKLLVGARVVDEQSGAPATFSAAGMRMVLFIVLSVVSSATYIAFLAMLVVGGIAIASIYSNDRRQTMWDRHAKTLVVRR